MNRLFNIFSATTIIMWAILITCSVSGADPVLVSGGAMVFAGSWIVIIAIAIYINHNRHGNS